MSLLASLHRICGMTCGCIISSTHEVSLGFRTNDFIQLYITLHHKKTIFYLENIIFSKIIYKNIIINFLNS